MQIFGIVQQFLDLFKTTTTPHLKTVFHYENDINPRTSYFMFILNIL